MSEEEFASKSTAEKWFHIETVMKYITQMDSMYDIRRRLNTHHSNKDKSDETRALRLDQYQRWAHIKGLYAQHRDELANTLDNDKFAECKSIMERIFTSEVDDALRDLMGDEK